MMAAAANQSSNLLPTSSASHVQSPS